MDFKNDDLELIDDIKQQNGLNNDVNKLDTTEENLLDETINDLEDKKEFIKQFVEDIHQKMDEMKSHITLVIDRIEGNIAVCEDRETEEITNIDVSELPEEIHEGDVLKLNEMNDKYEIDEQTKLEIQERIKNKIKNLFEETED